MIICFFVLLLFSLTTYAHTWEIRVNQNQNGTLTWYIQSYHTINETQCLTQANQSGLIINGIQYPIQQVLVGSIVPLSSTIFGVNTSCGTARNIYGVINTPFLGTTLNVVPYSNVVCWANCFINANGTFVPPPPPVCTTCPIIGWSNTVNLPGNNNGTPCDPTDDYTTANIKVNHLACANITGDKQFTVVFDPGGANVVYGPFNYAAGIETNVIINIPAGTTNSTTVSVVDNDFPCQVRHNLSIPGGVYPGERETEAPVITCPPSVTVSNDPGDCGAVVNYDQPTATDNCSSFNTGSRVYSYSGSIQIFTVPAGVTSVKIVAKGAQGGNNGGRGAIMQGNFAVTPGSNYKILVGGAGQTNFVACNQHHGSSGGGGSFVSTVTNTPLIVAGGGGGVLCAPNIGMDASTGINGMNGNSPAVPSLFGIGGVNGNGATNNSAGPHAGNGGGFYTAGQAALCGGPGQSFISGGAGGTPCGANTVGGFAGGAGGGNAGGGGGGGYSGGGGSYHYPGNGGGAGSYNAGTNQTNTVGNTGNGSVEISWSNGTIVQTAGLASGSTFPVGTTTNTFVATDAAGNTAECSFTVTVTDDEVPEIHLQNQFRCYEADNNGCDVDLGVTATDNCPGVITLTSDAPDCFEVGSTTVTWTATDAHGNSSTATQVVTRNPEIHVTICASPTATIYTNVGPQCVNLSASASGGTPGYTYNWAASPGLSSTNGPNAVVCPTTTTSYTVTVTDDKGCTRSLSFTVTVLPMSAAVCSGSGNNIKFNVCHVPPGNPSNPQNICISQNALNAHLTSGSNGHNNCYLGPCGQQLCASTIPAPPNFTRLAPGQSEENGKTELVSAFKVKVFPNPSNNDFRIQVDGNSNQPVLIRILDVNGVVKFRSQGNTEGNQFIVGENLRPGIYMAEVIQGTNREVIKLIKIN